MTEIVEMAMLEPGYDLAEDANSFLLWKTAVLHNVAEKLAVLDVLEDKVTAE